MAVLIIKRALSRDRRKRPVIIVPRSVSKKATERNRIKRRIKAALHSSFRGIKVNHVIIAQPEALDASFGEIKRELEKRLIRN